MVLEEKGLWEIVKGEEIAPDEEAEEEFLSYQRREHLAYVLICLILRDGPSEEVRHEMQAKKAWEALETMYEPKNLANVLRLKRELINLKMKGSDKVKDHVQILRAIAAELAAIGEPIPKREMAFMLLNSLPPSYNHLVVTIDGREEARDLEYVIARVEQEEQRLELHRESVSETALLTRKEWRGKASVESKRLAGDEERRTGDGAEYDPEDVICHYCKRRGHIARGCAKKLADIRKRRQGGQHMAHDGCNRKR